MNKWVWDIEANGLLLECDTMWILHVVNLVTKEQYTFLNGDLGWKDLFKEGDLHIGHNLQGYDIGVLKRLFDYDLPKGSIVHDTMIMSQVLDYRRFGMRGHKLELWGEFLGNEKIDWRGRAIELGLIDAKAPSGAEFKQFHPEMVDYCKQDVNVNVEVYKYLIAEFKGFVKKAPLVKLQLQVEHHVARWNMMAELHGWPFDVESAKKLEKVLKANLDEAYAKLKPKLGFKAVAVDKSKGVVNTKFPKWTKDGCYHKNTANWFGIDPLSGLDDCELNQCKGHREILGEYCRLRIEPLSLDSVADVKIFLNRNGWKPNEWNTKFNPETKRKEKTSPKITEDSLKFLGGDGKLYTDFLSTRSRYSILKTWLDNTDENGMLHGSCRTIGTPSMRMTHRIIVNVPAANSTWGPEMRSLFTCLPGWKLIGCDSAGNQARGLAHYLEDEEFIHILLNEDIHLYNATKMIECLDIMKYEHDFTPKSFRPKAKRIFYAFLFGAGGDKLWSYATGSFDKKRGTRFKNLFVKAVPGFKALVDKLEAIFGKTSQYGYGYIPSLSGNRIYVDSFHKLLVYLLQACEKITCGAALMLTMQKFEEEHIPYYPCIMMHDEFQALVPEEYAERALEIGVESFREGPKLFGIDIMNGDGKIGNNWYDTH